MGSAITTGSSITMEMILVQTKSRVRLIIMKLMENMRVRGIRWEVSGGCCDEGHLEGLLPLHPVASQVLLGNAASEVCQVTNLWPCKGH